ncbi:Tad domain-containing protein [Comamonas composti]|uniref:Tad domain-containing protein n=1 Tax=Comamonas composti TaxID=408558 RepID=UPI000A023C1E|nr:Tad domain-containing protein [Comamonas composti]
MKKTSLGGQSRRSAWLRSRQMGQVLVWFLAFAATLAVIFAGIYGVGQATSEKQKVVNAADAAAYSGGLVQARALNLVAYTNRAVVANEVLIAQVISLQSWNDYFKTATGNYQTIFQTLGAATAAIPGLGAVLTALGRVMGALERGAQGAEKALKGIVPTVIRTWELSFTAWYTGVIRPAFVPPVMALATNDASDSVLRQSVATQGGRHDEPAHLVQSKAIGVMNELEWQRMSHLYKKGQGGRDERKTAADLILNSRDEFSTERRGSDIFLLDLFFGNRTLCIPFVIKLGSEKQGPTKLVNYDRWEAQDTVEFKQKVGPNGWDGCSWGKGTTAVPVGWGRSVADLQGRNSGNRLRTDGGAGNLAYGNTKRNGGWSGIKELYDVPRDQSGQPSKQEMFYMVAVAKDKVQIRSNESMDIANRPMDSNLGSPDLKAGFSKDQISSLSEARIFFERPKRDNLDITGRNLFRADGHKEYASLYNPYWQVRLQEPSMANKALVYGALQMNPALAAFAQ